MLLNRIALGLSISMALVGIGCGGEDPLTATWNNDVCYGEKTAPEGIKSCSTELTFSSDLTFSVKVKQISEPATATAPGCTTTREITGQTWSTDGTTYSLSGTGKATMERSSCVNDADNFTAAPTTAITIPTGSSTYTINGNTLIIAAGPLAGTYLD